MRKKKIKESDLIKAFNHTKYGREINRELLVLISLTGFCLIVGVIGFVLNIGAWFEDVFYLIFILNFIFCMYLYGKRNGALQQFIEIQKDN